MAINNASGNIEIDQHTFKGLYDEYFVLVCRYAYAFLEDYEAARDVAAELFCELWKQRASISINTNIKNYLLVATRRSCKRYAEKMGRQQELMAHYPANDTLPETPDHNLAHKEAQARFHDLLSRLDPVKKEIIDLRLLGLSYKEIAKLLQITPRKVEYHMNAAIKHLQEEAGAMKAEQQETFLMLGSFLLMLGETIG